MACDDFLMMCSLRFIAKVLSPSGVLFQSLTSISLSFNHLQDRAVSHLAKLTAALPQLVALHVAGCGFTRAIWDLSGSYLHLSNIQILDLSCNALQARGLSGFLGNNQPASVIIRIIAISLKKDPTFYPFQ